jgi:ubiquinone/menaquinone biosynthesis C-methylase UbiE
MNKQEYWTQFWKTYGMENTDSDEQTQVLRTLNRKPISKELWDITLMGIEEQVKPNINHSLLDLCCGNGLISRYFSSKCKNIVSVDISDDLVGLIDLSKFTNIETIVSDIRKLSFDKKRFDRVIIYAGIQYFSMEETVEIFEKVHSWLKPGGIFYLGDIPNYDKRWEFYNNSARRKSYFENLKNGIDIVGTWYDPNYFKHLSEYTGFSRATCLPQQRDLIYSSFRYDYKVIK